MRRAGLLVALVLAFTGNAWSAGASLAVDNPRTFTMIDIDGMTPPQALHALGQRGWSGTFTTTDMLTDDLGLNGQIKESDPAEGSVVFRDGKITIRVYKAVS